MSHRSREQRPLADAAAAKLEDAILAGELRPGERLSEQALSALLGISRGPLREAVRSLEGRRLVERTPFSGVRVTQLSIDDVEQLLVTREALEGIACRQAAECMTLRQTRELRQCLSALGQRIDRDGVGSVYVHGTEDNDFHVQVVRGSGNSWLEEFLCRDLYALLRISRFKSAIIADRAATAMREHSEILSAIEDRDPDAAERLMRSHIAHARQNLIASLRQEQQASAGEPASSARRQPRAPREA